MGKKRFKTIRLFLKLMLLFQIYSHHCFKAEATVNNLTKSSYEDNNGEERGFNYQISDTGFNVAERPKRPARLIPLKILRGKDKDQSEKEDMRFYGPATSCEELLKIGYTRNGFYLVKGKNATSNSHVEIVNCLFSNPIGSKEVKEKRLGFLPMNKSFRKFHQRRSIESIPEFGFETIDTDTDRERSKRPGRLLPLQLLFRKEEDENITKPFYGPPTNCSELGKLGYTLNGYYLVNGSHSSRRIEVVFCRFKLPPRNNETQMEERIGFISLHQNTASFMDKRKSYDKDVKSTAKETNKSSIKGRKNRPVRLIPLKHMFKDGKLKNKSEEQPTQQINSNPVNCNEIEKLGYTLNGFYIVNVNYRDGIFGVVFCQFKMPPAGDNKTKQEERFGVIRVVNVKYGKMSPPRISSLINGQGNNPFVIKEFTSQKDETSMCSNIGLWNHGKVPYKISHEFIRGDFEVIRDALVEIMNTTCIKFVPHNNEPDYVVFLGYKHPDQKKRTCWSGNQWNNGTSTIGKKRGRHFVSLWQDLKCFNKLDIIREVFNILDFQAKSSTFISNPPGGSINYAFPFYEESFDGIEQQKQPNGFIGICMNESTYLKKHPYAFDNKKEWVSIVKKDTCRIMRNMKQINRIYNCPIHNYSGNYLSKIQAHKIKFDSSRPNCKAEAETGACQFDPVYMRSISCSDFCAGWGSLYGIPSPRRANLINGFGKCLGIGLPNSKNKDRYLYQWDCNSSNDAMLWSWNQVTLDSGNRHLCNGRGACVASNGNVGNNIHLLTYIHLDEQAQMFHFSDSLAHPGFYVIQNDYGKCLSVNMNKDQTGAQIWVRDCNKPSEAGQRWKWLQ